MGSCRGYNLNLSEMRKILLSFTLIAFIMTACTKKSEAQNKIKSKRTLVAYFSATGTTKGVAEKIAKVLGAELFEISPETPYTAADLDWTNRQSRSSIEMNTPDSRPALAKKIDNIADYDTIFIGYPVWWYVAPHLINSFVECHNLKGKTLIPFATSGGSPIGPTVDELRKEYPLLNWHDGALLNRASETSIKSWLETL